MTMVHTSGINWESLLTIVTMVVTLVGLVVGWIGRRITQAVGELGTRLELKLETKEAVQALQTRVVVLEQWLMAYGGTPPSVHGTSQQP